MHPEESPNLRRDSRFRAPHMGPRGFLTFFILRLLKEEPRSGYDLMKVISEKTHGAWDPSSGIIYPTLMGLEKQKLIEEVEDQEEAQKSERGRKSYGITKKGEEHLRQWEAQRQEFISKIKGWREFWLSFWTPSLGEALDMLEETLSILELTSTEVKKLPKERVEAAKKALKEASEKLGVISKKL